MIGLLFMRRKGFEPSHPYGHMRLKHACLPFHHLRLLSIITYFCENANSEYQFFSYSERSRKISIFSLLK